MADQVFKFDSATLQVIQKLKQQLGARSEGEVLQKALVLAELAAKKADANGVVSIGEGESEVKVSLAR